ncbi:uncharacterized protein MICPUCDRAFT_42094 [Micromonas pusilla CCMP1545]|uniref:Predicted protein n=1 Tax=Micromonas pusilla (strain CCMP1545) TaxID=564608 RepID=C1N322_MICPC|nr:uncharacterized protein MICPUCDRAFT_42094 [Micromonas pusilla CCMP1545]EEH53124.1 predicted protein [Micromonas pusilla CCMP1545]|eukprot:XP_003062305.1 predicted protein [Micromonas pusilla CCMP1545]
MRARPRFFSAQASEEDEAATAEEDADDADGGVDAAAPPAAGPVKLYVGNLSWGVDDSMLTDVFAEYDASGIAVISDMNTGRSRGFGFVEVPSQEIAEKAIAELDGADVDGRPIRVNISEARSSRREYDGERGERAPRERNYDFDARKVYFGNLSWGMDHLDLQDLCGEYGEVADSRLITDRETGRSRGFGFVTMSSAEQAEKVVNGLNGQDVDGRVLRVNIANVDGR